MPVTVKKPRPKAKRNAPATRAALLDEAAAELNARGISGVLVNRIADRAGVSRASLYYHFEDRDDLAFRCFVRSCETMAEDLEAADREHTGLDKLLAAIRRLLDPRRPHRAVLTEVPYLEEEKRSAIEAAHRRNVLRLRRFLDDGVADGSVRDCDTEVACQAIVGMVSWVPLASGWAAGAGEASMRRAAEALAGLVRDGVAADRARVIACPIDVAAFARKPGRAFDPREAKAAKIEEIARTASWLFNRYGIDGTSLDAVTSALGATKGAFYHYLSDKAELVVRCYERAYDLYERFADAAEAAGADGLDRSMFGLHLNVQAHVADLSPLAPLTGVEALPKRARDRLRRRTVAIEQRFERFGREGIADGSMRPYDVPVLAVAGAGAFGWIPKWLPENDPRPPRAVADEIVALFVRGLRT
jgi:AcrR family transcriptional regulator